MVVPGVLRMYLLICYEVLPEMEVYEGQWEQKNGKIGLKGGGIQVKGSEPLSYNALDKTLHVLNIYNVHRLACIHVCYMYHANYYARLQVESN